MFMEVALHTFMTSTLNADKLVKLIQRQIHFHFRRDLWTTRVNILIITLQVLLLLQDIVMCLLLFCRPDLQFFREQVWLPGSDHRGVVPGGSLLGPQCLRTKRSDALFHHRVGNRYVQTLVHSKLYQHRLVYVKSKNLYVDFQIFFFGCHWQHLPLPVHICWILLLMAKGYSVLICYSLV
jgi:hypothetical protein